MSQEAAAKLVEVAVTTEANQPRPPVPQARIWRLLQSTILQELVYMHKQVFGRSGHSRPHISYGLPGEEVASQYRKQAFQVGYEAGNLLIQGGY